MGLTQPQVERVAGVVEAANERGVKIGGQWSSFSKFGEVLRSMKGARIELQVKGGGIQSLEVAEDAAPPESGRRLDSDGSRERTIARLAVLKSAAANCASRPEAKAADVLTVASAGCCTRTTSPCPRCGAARRGLRPA